MELTELERLRDVLSIDSELNTIKDKDILLERILSEARKILNADAGSIWERQGDNIVITYAQNDTIQKRLPPGQRLPYSSVTVPINKRSIAGYVADTRKTVNIPDAYAIPASAPYGFASSYDEQNDYHTKSVLGFPLKTPGGDVLGVLQILNRLGNTGETVAFNADDEQLAEHFAANATVALERAKLTRSMLIRQIDMARMRDPKETGPHVNRVAGYAVEIYERWARHMSIPQHKIEKTKDNLRMAAMLHDVGKVAISDTILQAPRKFTDEEREIMQTHTWRGAQLFLTRESDFDELALDIALNHHESWDGTGYPGHVDLMTGAPLEKHRDGTAVRKQGKEIPLFGRIVSIADVYDALRSHRVYKEAWSEDDVLKEIRDLGGVKFDPDLVDVFFEILPLIQSIGARFSDAA